MLRSVYNILLEIKADPFICTRSNQSVQVCGLRWIARGLVGLDCRIHLRKEYVQMTHYIIRVTAMRWCAAVRPEELTRTLPFDVSAIVAAVKKGHD
jgi:hypothetical protein